MYCRDFNGDPIPAETVVDFTVANHGSVVLLKTLTPDAEEWVEEHVGGEDTQTWGGALCIEPRYITPIVDALHAEGFEGAVI